jgi:hypothetical protein
MHTNTKKFEVKERTFDRVPPKRHSSYEDRIKGDTVTKKTDPRLYVTQRNCNSSHKKGNFDRNTNIYHNNEYSISNGNEDFMPNRGNSNSIIQDYIKRATTGAGQNRHLQPRQTGHSPRQTHKIHLNPSEKKKKFTKDASYGRRGIDAKSIVMIREAQNQSAGNNFVVDQKAKRNRSSELINGYYKINRAKLYKKQYAIP